MTLGDHVRTARNIHAHIYGKESIWQEVNVNLWILTARIITAELKSPNFTDTLKQLQSIPENILTQINITK